VRKPAPPPVFGSKSAPILDDASGCAGFLGKQQGTRKRIPGGAIDAVKVGETSRVHQRQERDAMIGTRHIQVDPRDVSEIPAVLMSLEQEMPAIIIVRRGATRIMIK